MTTTVAPTAQSAVAVSSFTQSIGINTHIDFSWTPYADLSAVQSALSYLGIKTVRDAIDNPSDLAEFTELNQDLGVKFDFFIAPGSVGMPWQLAQIESVPSIVAYVEGANESDNWPQTYNGLTGMAATNAEQVALAASAKQELPGIPVIAPSFGWLSSFASASNLSADANYGNAHIYFGTGNNPGANGWIQTLIQDANEVAPGEKVMTTETGYYTGDSTVDQNAVSDIVQAKYLLDDVLDQFKAGVSMDFLYELVDQGTDTTNGEDNFGLFNNNWTAKPSATAIHDLMTILNDPGAGTATAVTPGSLTYSLTGMPSTANSLLMEKSDGTFVLAVWNDVQLQNPATGAAITVANVPVTLTLGTAANVVIFDPLTGTSSIESANGVSQLTISLPDHPILIEIGPKAGTVTPLATNQPAPAALPSNPTGVTVNVPASGTFQAGQTTAISGVSLTDAWAAANDGAMGLTLSVTSGKLIMTDTAGNPVAGSGTSTISLSETLFQLNTDLAHLEYVAPSGVTSDTLSIDVWDPAGLEGVATLTLKAGSAATTGTTGTGTTGTGTAGTGTTGTGTTGSTTGTASPPSSSSSASSPSGPTIALPASETVTAGSSVAVSGVSITDAFAAANPGALGLYLSAGDGALTVTSLGGATITGSGTSTLSVTGTLAQINAELATLHYSAPATGKSDAITVDIWDQAGMEATQSIAVTINPASSTTGSTTTGTTNPHVAAPASESVTVGTSATINGLSIIDTFAASNPGTLALNLSTSAGTISMTNAAGTKVSGSGTKAISVSGTLSQLNADLGRLIFTAAAKTGSATLSVDVWDQAGQELTASIPISMLAAAVPALAASLNGALPAAGAAPSGTTTYPAAVIGSVGLQSVTSGGTAMLTHLTTH